MSPRCHQPCRTTRNGTDVSSGRTTCAMCSSTAGRRSPGPGIAIARQPSVRRRTVATVASIACGVLVTTSCSGRARGPVVAQLTGNPPTAGSLTPTGHASNGAASALAHAECMRSHNVPDFPDPGPISIDTRAHPDLDPSSPTFVAAQHACLSLAPAGAAGGTVSPQLQEAALAYSACMRSHGFPKFADPVFDNRGEHVPINGIDTDSAQFRSSDQTCQASTGLAALSNPSTGSR